MPKANRMVRYVAKLMLALLVAVAVLSPRLVARAEEAPDPYADAAVVSLADGDYLMDVSLEGGSGRASVTSPAPLSVVEGRAVATIEWSSPNYDYMLVAGKRYLPTNTEGNSTFVIPVLALDEPFDVVGDTTAMSQPHEIDYQLTFDSASAKPVPHDEPTSSQPIAPVVIACLAGTAAAVLFVRRVSRRPQ